MRGYRRALVEHGGFEPIVQEVPGWTPEGGLEAVGQLRAEHPQVDGIVCGNDDIARGAIAGLHGMGVRIPEDIAVIGHDNIHEAILTTPPLTTIDPDRPRLAATVLDLLLERIGGYRGEPRVVTTPHRLVERGSVG